MVAAVFFFEDLVVFNQNSQSHAPEDSNIHSCRKPRNTCGSRVLVLRCHLDENPLQRAIITQG
jgi:hypothetical protein